MIRLCAFADESSSDLYGQIDALNRNGISLIELRSIAGQNVADFSLEKAREYQLEFEKNKISVWSIGSPLGKVDINVDFNEYEKKVVHVLELAKVFKCKRIRMFSFFNAYDKKGQVFRYLNRMVELAKDYGIILCHENEKEIFGDTADNILSIMENVEGLRYIYDPANFLQCGEDPERTLSLFHAKSEYYHIKDVIKETDELVPAGHGDGNILKLIKMIEKDAVLTLEPHLAVFDSFKDIDNTEMKHKFKFENPEQAFDFAVEELKKLLVLAGYRFENGEYIK